MWKQHQQGVEHHEASAGPGLRQLQRDHVRERARGLRRQGRHGLRRVGAATSRSTTPLLLAWTRPRPSSGSEVPLAYLQVNDENDAAARSVQPASSTPVYINIVASVGFRVCPPSAIVAKENPDVHFW